MGFMCPLEGGGSLWLKKGALVNTDSDVQQMCVTSYLTNSLKSKNKQSFQEYPWLLIQDETIIKTTPKFLKYEKSQVKSVHAYITCTCVHENNHVSVLNSKKVKFSFVKRKPIRIYFKPQTFKLL